MSEHALDLRDGSSSLSVERGECGAETVLGHIAEFKPVADATEHLLAKLGAVRLAVLGGEYPWAQRLRHCVDHRPEPLRNGQNAGFLAFRLAHRVGPVRHIKPLPPHTEHFGLTHAEPNHDTQDHAHMGVAGFRVQGSEELGDATTGNHRAGLLLNPKARHLKRDLREVAHLHGETKDRPYGFEGVVRIGGRLPRRELLISHL